MSKKQEAGWRCPQCGRRFRQRTREHSCDVRTVDAHLDGAAPHVKEIAGKVFGVLPRIGPHAVVPVKTMILLRAGSNFGGLVVRKDALDLEFVLRRLLRHQRIRKSEQVGASKYSHHVRLSSTTDVDSQLEQWLREAYEVVQKREEER